MGRREEDTDGLLVELLAMEGRLADGKAPCGRLNPSETRLQQLSQLKVEQGRLDGRVQECLIDMQRLCDDGADLLSPDHLQRIRRQHQQLTDTNYHIKSKLNAMIDRFLAIFLIIKK